MADWIEQHAALMWWLVGVSGACFVATLFAVPWIVVRLPADYFTTGQQRVRRHRHPAVHIVVAIARNVIGYVFILIGIAMLVLPGQGVLTILAGLGLVDFPGKQQVIRRLVARGPVRKSLNWIRERAGRPPLEIDG